jgi:peptidoglycan-associated lipoprotein
VETGGSRQVTPSRLNHLPSRRQRRRRNPGCHRSRDRQRRARAAAVSGYNATEEELFAQNVKDIYFDYDKDDVRASEQGSLQGDAQFLQQHPNIHITVEGHCDERGSTEYNLALGTNRADAVKNALIQAGVSGEPHQDDYSYGKEKPFCTESNESCWQQNRRGHFVYEK